MPSPLSPSDVSTPTSLSSRISPVTEIVAELKAGRIIILMDDEARENEGDLLMAADFVTPETINFMVTHGRGLVCLTLTEERCRQLGLSLMTPKNGARFKTNFTVSIEAAEGVETGISAADRAHTVRVAVARDAKPTDLVQPGHIFPVQAQPGGVLVRAGHTEAGCDLTAMAGLTPAAVICETLKPDGSMARLPDLLAFAQTHQLKIGTVADLIQYRSEHESLIQQLNTCSMRTPWGEFEVFAYRDTISQDSVHLAFVHGKIDPQRETLVRVHEPTSVLDVLDIGAGTHSWSVAHALSAIAAAPAGVVVLMNCHLGGRHLLTQLKQWQPPVGSRAKKGGDESMSLRTYGIGAQILRDLNVGTMKLLALPRKMPSVAGFSLSVCGHIRDSSAP